MIRKNAPAAESGPNVTSIVVLGPYLSEQIKEMVAGGMLDADDELCQENGYWFFLHEAEELKRFLGIENLVVRRSPDDEATQPDLAQDEATQPEIAIAPPGGGLELESIESSVEGNPESTGVIKINRPPKPAPAPAQPRAVAPPVANGTSVVAPNASAPRPIVTTAKAPTAAELKNKYPRLAPPPPSPYSNVHGQTPAPILGMERGRFWGILLAVFLLLAGIGVIWLIKSLRA